MNGKTIYYAIKIGDEYMQGIEPNENYCRSGTAPTMGARYSYSEFKSIWGYDIKSIESLTVTSYLKVLFEEYRWNEKELEKIEVIPITGKEMTRSDDE